MSRIARIVLEGIPYHITQRSNGRQQVFFDERDYALYLDLLRVYSQEAKLQILAYCVMPNHIHLIAVPARPDSMAAALGRSHADFARHFNLRHRSCGHVWQSRYFSCPLDEVDLWLAMAYVERNPVRARIVERAESFRWSSAAGRLADGHGPDWVELSRWQAEYTRDQWRQVLETSVGEESFGRRLQEASRRGRPLGQESFAHGLEQQAGRPLLPRAVGRPRKQIPEGDQLSLQISV